MKVAYFIGGLNRGGAESLLLDVCRKHQFVPYDFVCVYRHEGNLSQEFKQSGAPLIQAPKEGGMIRYMLFLRKLFVREHVNIIHSQTPSNTLLLSLALIGTGIKIVTTFHGHSFADAAWWQRKLVYAASEKIICVSNYQKQYYEKKWQLPEENKLQVVYNGVDFSKLKVHYQKPEFLSSGNKLSLAMVGSFNTGRSQMVVCKALKILHDQEKTNFDFYFIGSQYRGEEYLYHECVQYCEGYGLLGTIHFVGARDDVPAVLQHIDGFIYSTVTDTFGIAIVEAMASGVPTIVNDWDVMTEITNDGQWATIYQSGDAEVLAHEIEKLLNNVQQYKTVAIKHAIEIKKRYSIKSHIRNLYKIYNSL